MGEEAPHKLHDHLAKQILEAALDPLCKVQLERGVTAQVHAIDAVSQPRAHPKIPWSQAGLLGRMAQQVCAFEHYHEPPDDEELELCIVRRFLWHLSRKRSAKKAKKESPDKPFLWVISTGRPEATMQGFGFAAWEGWPEGVYTAPPGLRVGLVVLRELPEDVATLSLRLMGQERVRERALLQAMSLPDDDPLCLLAESIADHLTPHLPNTELAMPTLVERYLQRLQDLQHHSHQEGRQEGRQEGLGEGLGMAVRLMLTQRFPEHGAWDEWLALVPPNADWQKLFTELLQAQDAQAARAMLQRQASAPNPA